VQPVTPGVAPLPLDRPLSPAQPVTPGVAPLPLDRPQPPVQPVTPGVAPLPADRPLSPVTPVQPVTPGVAPQPLDRPLSPAQPVTPGVAPLPLDRPLSPAQPVTPPGAGPETDPNRAPVLTPLPPSTPRLAPTPQGGVAPNRDSEFVPAPIQPVGGPAPIQPMQQPERLAPVPIGAAAQTETPPVVVLTPAGQPPLTPESRSYDEKMHMVKQGEDYRALSQQFYNSDRFAAALREYNRTRNPQATDNLRAGNEPLPNETILVPPIHVLEPRDGLAAAAKPLTPAAVAQPGMPYPTYRVSGDNENLRVVALRALNNGDRWMEIKQLNAFVNPEQPVPTGTVLRLPPDATVPAENR
jgi:hypothetical protein